MLVREDYLAICYHEDTKIRVFNNFHKGKSVKLELSSLPISEGPYARGSCCMKWEDL